MINNYIYIYYMTFINTLGQIPEMEKMTTFEKVDNKKLIEIKAKLEVLEMVGGIVDSLREGLTRQLVVNDINSEEKLEEKIGNLVIREE